VQLNLNIDPEEINRYVTQQVLDSAIGESVRKAIEKSLEPLSRTYDNPLEPVIRDQVFKVVRELVDKEYKTQIEEYVRQRITPEFVGKMSERLWDNFFEAKCR
jgi:hypothetical protein